MNRSRAMARSRILSLALASFSWLALVPACGSDQVDEPTELDTPEICNPLGGLECVTPWPSSVYTVDDPDSPTGVRLEVPAGALPTNNMGVAIDPVFLNGRDGFSPAAPIIVAFPEGMDGSNLVTAARMEASVTESSPTVLVDMSTGERVEHFAELDLANEDWPEQQALYIRPSSRLRGSRRYAVGLRRTLRAKDGGEIATPAGFSAIRDGRETTHPALERIRPRYEAIFEALDGAGVPGEELLLAWDFTTASDESIRSDVLHARDRALPIMGEDGQNLGYEILTDTVHDDPAIRRSVHGMYDAPLFLDSGGAHEASTRLARDEAGAPEAQGLYRVPFWAVVPECAYEAATPVPVMIYLHGLMGTGEQATSGDVRAAASAVCMVAIGTNMRGMSTPDFGSVATMLTDFNQNGALEQLVQGLVNHFALQHIVRGPMAETLFVDEAGAPLVDATRVVVYGLSQGHIFGTSFLAYDTFIERGVFGVGGGNYSLMLERSSNWSTYHQFLRGGYPRPLAQALFLSLAQSLWDATEASGTANDALTGAIPGTPPKQMLLHMGHADEQVPNLATAWQARTMGIPLLAPAPYDIHGLATEPGPLTNGLVIYHGGVEDPPLGNVPPEDTDSHYVTRRQPAAFRQMARFYETGEIVNECAGPCLCAEGACE